MDKKISVIIPVLWADDTYLDMTLKCIKTMGNVGQIIPVINNAGFAENVNAGLRAATGDYLIICNNDVEFIQPDWLYHLITPLKDTYHISSICTTDSDGWQTYDYYEPNAKFGSLWCMKREVYDTLGGLDESFGKGYFEDLDYHKRAKEAGFNIVKNHAGLVDHTGKATFKHVDPDDTSYAEARNKFIKKWGEVW